MLERPVSVWRLMDKTDNEGDFDPNVVLRKGGLSALDQPSG
jgi:hypothetical protein